MPAAAGDVSCRCRAQGWRGTGRRRPSAAVAAVADAVAAAADAAAGVDVRWLCAPPAASVFFTMRMEKFKEKRKN
jgi:hypothetical protein